MKSQLVWPRVLRDIVIILLIAAALMVAISVGILHSTEIAPGPGPAEARAASVSPPAH